MIMPMPYYVKAVSIASFNFTAGASGSDEGHAKSGSTLFSAMGTLNSGDKTFKGETILAAAWDASAAASRIELSGGGDGFVTSVTVNGGAEKGVLFDSTGVWTFSFDQEFVSGNSYDIVIKG